MASRTFQEDLDFLAEYNQWKVTAKGDTSPAAFMVYKGQTEAFDKLEQVIEWFKEFEPEMSGVAALALEAILK